MDPNILYAVLFYFALIWSIFWKAVALWRSAKSNQTIWFIAILIVGIVINPLGILEIIYLFWFAKKKLTIDEMRGWIENFSSFRLKKRNK